MSTEPVSPDNQEMTRITAAQLQSELVRRIALITQTRIATCMGVHASTVSRMVSEDLERLTLLLAALDLKLAPIDSMVVDETELSALESMSEKYLHMRRSLRNKGIA